MFFQFALFVCALFLIWRVLFQKNSGPPELTGKLPIIGHVHCILWKDSMGLWEFLKMAFKESLEKGGVIRFNMGPRIMYVLTDPEDCLTVSKACLEKDRIYSFAKGFLGDGLITGSVPIWKKHRKLLNPAFNQSVLTNFVRVFNSQARRLIDQFSCEVGKPFDHEHLLRLNNLETICLTATGVGSDEYNSLQKQYLCLFGEFLKVILERFQKFWLHNDFLYNLSSLKKRTDMTVKSLVILSSTIVQQRKRDMETALLNDKLEIKQQGKPKPFMDLILELANETNCFTDEEIREETDNIVAGGHDTTASTLTFVFMLLGTYPEIQKKVYDEIVQVIGLKDRDLDKEDLSKLVYIEAVLKESLRLYPIAPVIARYIDRDVKLRNYTLKAKSCCFLSPYGLHRDAIWGSDANDFKPERWLDQATLPDLNYFGGFGLGGRSCIGKVFALMSMKTITAHMVRRYRIKSDISNLKLKFVLMLRPVSGHYISIEPRNKSIIESNEIHCCKKV